MQEFSFDQLDDLYRKSILNHYRKPRNMGSLPKPDIEYEEYNPVCGDQVVLQVKLDGERIAKAGFSGRGCSISQASASMMTEVLLGKTLEEAEGLAETFRRLLQGRTRSKDELTNLGDLTALEGVRRFPVRVKCALLACSALEQGIEEYRAAVGEA